MDLKRGLEHLVVSSVFSGGKKRRKQKGGEFSSTGKCRRERGEKRTCPAFAFGRRTSGGAGCCPRIWRPDRVANPKEGGGGHDRMDMHRSFEPKANAGFGKDRLICQPPDWREGELPINTLSKKAFGEISTSALSQVGGEGGRGKDLKI